ncbi:HAD family hydrolase [Rossellomorea sp. NS-SX7]|uniref:HAD family hydrolase n=1 Tax=Rossellomorea sp. NS-SX7 TaxID=3463856 RepID=UPI004059E998
MQLEKYDALLFDLDDTLFNHTNCYKKAVKDILKSHNSLNHLDEEVFFSTFSKNNQELLREYQSNKLPFQEFNLKRLGMTLKQFSVNLSNEETEKINEGYHVNYLKNIVPNPQIQKLFRRLKDTFKMGVVTNGTSYNAYKKINRLGLSGFFSEEHIIVSEEIGYSKPQREIFLHVLDHFTIKPEKSLFIGDNYYTDMCGASSVGMDTLWINHLGMDPPSDFTPVYILKNVLDLEDYLHI